MNVRFLINFILSKKKATHICVAFFISSLGICKPLFEDPELKQLSEIKKLITTYLIKKDRSSALKKILVEEQNNYNPAYLKNIFSIKEIILTSFLTQETQDFYELSTSILFKNLRLSEKHINICLKNEPENLLCQWQYLKILKFRNDTLFRTHTEAFIKLSYRLPTMSLLAHSLSPNAKIISRLDLHRENLILFYILEFESALKNKNYSYAKETTQSLYNISPDYPDLLWMKAQLSELSTETPLDKNYQTYLNIYKKICSSLSSELTRKYYYDIDLCHSGQ